MRASLSGLGRLRDPGALRRLRLATGLTLFTYVGLHLLDHALGNVSIAWMEAGLAVQKLLWQGVLGTALLYPALAIHYLLGLWAFYARRQYGWARAEVVQLVLGLAIPFLLMNHLFATRISLAVFATEKTYAQELYSFWVGAPLFGAVQVALLIVAWSHGAIGVWRWLRLKRGFAQLAPLLLAGAVLLPVLALLGFFQGGRTMLALAHDPAWRAANLNPWQVGLPAQNAALKAWRNASLLAALALMGLVLAGRGARVLRERRGGRIVVAYPDGRRVRVPTGFSVLEASRLGRVPHASVCGGRARCSTCRVRVVGGGAALPSPLATERAVLERVGAGPGVRLACQLRPRADVAVVPLLPPDRPLLHGAGAPRPGEERFIVALVADMRNSVRLAETRLPFDTVFIIDRFVAALAEAVAEAGGRANQFTGDGLLATFGLAVSPEVACRQAVAAVARIGARVAALNALLEPEMAEPIAFGMGVHGGPAIVGEIGYGERRVFATFGEAANLASRLEALCKEFGCEAVLSEAVCRGAGAALDGLPRREAVVRGRTAPLAVRTVARAAELAALLAGFS